MQFSVKEWTLQFFCKVIRFRGVQKYQKQEHEDDIQDALIPLNAIF